MTRRTTKPLLSFLQSFTARGHRYYYFRRPGYARVRLPGLPGSEEFMSAYQAALTASTPRQDIGLDRSKPGTVAALVAAYTETAHFKYELAAETRRTQWAILQRFRDEHGDKPVAKLKREHLLAILAGKRPYPKRNWLKALRPLMRFAVSIGMHTEDTTKDIKAGVSRKGDGFRAWGEEEIAIFRAHHRIGSRARLAFELLLNTVQRRGDVIRMGPQHIRDGLMHVQQSKTGERLRLPIAPCTAGCDRGCTVRAFDVSHHEQRQAIYCGRIWKLVSRGMQRSWTAWFQRAWLAQGRVSSSSGSGMHRTRDRGVVWASNAERSCALHAGCGSGGHGARGVDQSRNIAVKLCGPECQTSRKVVEKQGLKTDVVGPGGLEPPTRPL